jgi:hypothetical protein
MNTIRFPILGALIWLSATSVRADWRVGAESGALFESNLSNSIDDADAAADWAWKSEARASNGLQLSRDLRLDLAGDIRGEWWDRYGAFNRFGGGAAGALRYRFGLGRGAPWISLENRIGYDRFQETERSGWDESLRLRGGIAVSQRCALEAGYTFENVSAENDFFDLQSHSADLRVIVDLTSSLQVALGYAFRDGDVISYAVPPRPDIMPFASVFRPVSTFGTNPRYTAYRLDGQTHAVSFSASYSLTKSLALEVDYQYAVTSHESLRYQNHLVEAKMAFAY